MARGIFGGMIFGGAISVAAAGAISVLLDPPTRPEAAVQAPGGTNAPAALDKQAAAGYGDSDLVTEGGSAKVTAPALEDTAAATVAGVDTPQVPEAGGTDAPSFSNGADGSETALAALPRAEPVLPAPQGALPNAPGAEAELSISTEPAQPPAPPVEDPLDNLEPGTLDAPQALQTPDTAIDAPAITARTQDEPAAGQDTAEALQAPSSDAAPSADVAAAAPPPPPEPESVETVEPEAIASDATDEPQVPEAPDTEVASISEPAEPPASDDAVSLEGEVVAAALDEAPEAAEPEPTAEALAPETAAPETTAPETPQSQLPETEVAQNEVPELDTQAEVVAQSDTALPRPRIGRPAGSIIDRRATEEAATDAPENTATPAAPAASGPPLEAFAATFENPENKPLMSIVLIDSSTPLGDPETGLAALESFPYPLTFAVNATVAGAQDRMNAYRAAGFEVMAMMDLPGGATAQDAAINLDAALNAVPEAVALIEGPDNGLQESEDVTNQLISVLQETGHGIVLRAKGLNSAQKDAVRSGVPAQIIFRDVDSAGQNARTIRRFLDQAAFRANQEGGVIMLGRLRPDTISALVLWGNQDRAQRVALSPISAVLTR